jgi:hypothetical protein
MLTDEVKDGPSFLAFFFQQVGVCFAALIWGVVASEWLAHVAALSPVAELLEATANIAAGIGPPFFAGRLIRARFSYLGPSGRLIWILPTILMAGALFWSGFNLRLARDMSDLLYPPEGPEAYWAVAFFSYPTFGCAGYSLGVWFQGRRFG